MLASSPHIVACAMQAHTLVTFYTVMAMHPKDADGMTNGVNTDETAPFVWSEITLFAQPYLHEYLNLGSLRYMYTYNMR